MSKPITLKDISNEITLKDAASMIEMESGQTSEWRTLFNGMSYEQKNEYYELKEQILNKQPLQQFSKENIRRDYLAFYHQGVTKGSFSYTVEHFLEEVNSDLDLEKIKNSLWP
ncbi:MAG: hypothetical protein NVV82_00460 [Sporocytophaga sp.]|nr:hypothetical protein [Sporocytophaga sp.]